MSPHTFALIALIASLALATITVVTVIVRAARQYAADREREKHYADLWRKTHLAQRQADK